MYNHSILGGTFDHFHLGHQRLISAALNKSRKLTIGITTEKMIKDKILSSVIQSYDERENSVREFIEWNLRQCFCEAKNIDNKDLKVEIIPLTNIYGNALKEKNIQAIFVTEDTKPGAVRTNRERKILGWSELETIIVPFVNDENGKKITSERIRKGEIDREGKVFLNLFKKDLRMPDELRDKLGKPWGMVIDIRRHSGKPGAVLYLAHPESLDPGQARMTIAVGDIVSQKLVEAGIPADVNIIDGKTQRRKIKNTKNNELGIKNKAGTINSITVFTLNEIIRKQNFPRFLFIEGEEDLLALPAILLAPLGSCVCYGLRDRGAVMVEVSEEIKEKLQKILIHFKN